MLKGRTARLHLFLKCRNSLRHSVVLDRVESVRPELPSQELVREEDVAVQDDDGEQLAADELEEVELKMRKDISLQAI